MVSKEIKDMYILAAKNLSDAKQAIGEALATDLTFGGNNIAAFLEETKAVTSAIGCVMGLLARNGEHVEPVEKQDGFVYMMIEGRKLICSVNQLTGKLPDSASSVHLESVSPINSIHETSDASKETVFQENENNKVSIESISSEHFEDDSDSIPNEQTNVTDVTQETDEKEEFLTENSNLSQNPANEVELKEAPAEVSEDTNEAVNEENHDLTEDALTKKEEEHPTTTANKNSGSAEIPEVSNEVKDVKENEGKRGAHIVMPKFDETNVSMIGSLGDIFQDEKSKPIDEFVFETYRIMINHMGIGKGEDMTFMIAPLKISKYAEANAPIVVYAYYKGRSYIRSSYDALDDGRNTVTMQIGDYELLFRASFDGNGIFQSMIATTGISANQGDRINVIDKKSHCPVGKQVKNGHIKFRYTSWDNGSNVPGTMEVFPVSEEEDEYVVLAVHGEWRDSVYLSRRAGGLPEMRIKAEDGIPSALICMRNGDSIDADIVYR